MTWTKIVGYGLILTCIVVWFFPIAGALVTVLKSPSDYIALSFWSLPPIEKIPGNVVANIHDALVVANLWPNFVNSLIYATSGAAAAAIAASLAAYALVFLRVRAPMFWFLLLYGPNYVVFQMWLIPLYKNLRLVNLFDTRFGLAFVYFSITIMFAVLVFRNFSLTLPAELVDMARIDGASNLQVYFLIFIPLTLSAFAVIFVFQFLWIWNDLLFGQVLTEQNARPIMSALSRLEGMYAGSTVPQRLGGALFAAIPPLLVILLLQRYFVTGIKLWVGKE